VLLARKQASVAIRAAVMICVIVFNEGGVVSCCGVEKWMPLLVWAFHSDLFANAGRRWHWSDLTAATIGEWRYFPL